MSNLYILTFTQDEGLESSEIFLDQRQNQNIPTKFLLSLINFVLTSNNFVFNDKHYIQIQGTAMGTKMAPSYACLFMGILEQKILAQATDKPELWIRFIDDILVIWLHGQEKWDEFLEHLNSFHQSIKFVSSDSDKSVPFLDINLTIENGRIETDLYSKPTDCHQYLSWNSCHPHGTKKSIPYSQALRLRRICSKQKDFLKRLHELEGYLRVCGYRQKCINEAFNKVKAMTRASTLVYKTNIRNGDRTTFPITYHPNLRNLSGILLDKHSNILLRDPINRTIFPEPAMVAYRRPKNLRDQITRARITQTRISEPGFHNCKMPKCNLHTETIEGDKFVSTVTGQSYKMTQNLNCDSHNVIYLATCNKPNCKQQYVGETGRRLKDRAPEHIRDIENRKDCPVAVHFSSSNHFKNNLTIQGIEHCKINNTYYRKCREKYWQQILKPQINLQNCGNKRPPSKRKPLGHNRRRPSVVHNRKRKIKK